MIHFRLRDYASVLFYRLLKPFFGRFGKSVRIVFPLRIVGAKYVALADNVTLQFGAYVAVLREHDEPPLLSIGRGTMVGNYVHIICTRRITIGEQVLMADRIYISDNSHGFEDVGQPVLTQKLRQLNDVEIGDGSWIGENVCIIGCRIGRHCVVAANSVVTRDVPDFTVVAGTPAVAIKRYCHETGAWKRVGTDGTVAP